MLQAQAQTDSEYAYLPLINRAEATPTPTATATPLPTSTPTQLSTVAPTQTPAATPQTPNPPAGAVQLSPFDANASDLHGPSSWRTRYGKSPEIIVASNGSSLHVLAQDYDDSKAANAVLLHIEPSGNGYQISQSLSSIPMLDRVMGLAIDEDGNRYYATGVAEDDVVDANYPP